MLILLTACADPLQIESVESNSTSSIEPQSNQTGSQAMASTFTPSLLSNMVVVDSINEQPVVRAEHSIGQGKLIMISGEHEEHGHLNVSSNYGIEGDQTFQSNYSIIYRTAAKDTTLLELPAFLYVQPSEYNLSFKLIEFRDADVYMLTPQYKTGHGVEGYLFAIDKKSGEVFPLTLTEKGKLHKTLVYSEAAVMPTVKDEKLIVQPPTGAGGDPEPARKYTLDLQNKTLIAL